jgi:hypothetical protein
VIAKTSLDYEAISAILIVFELQHKLMPTHILLFCIGDCMSLLVILAALLHRLC